MLPERLQSTEGPAESLANQSPGRFRSFSPGNGFLVITDAPAEAANSNGEVRVFRDGIRGDATRGLNGLFSPCAKRAGDDRDAIQKIERALLHILAGDVFERLPAREPTRAIADFDIAGDCANGGIGKMAEKFADGVRLDFGVGVDGDDDFGGGFRQRAVQGSRFAAIDL